jgi:hypothetical protein
MKSGSTCDAGRGAGMIRNTHIESNQRISALAETVAASYGGDGIP